MDIDALTTFFAWFTALNVGFLGLAALGLTMMGDWASDLHARWYGLDKADVRKLYFQWLAAYKLLVLVFALTPYLALRLS